MIDVNLGALARGTSDADVALRSLQQVLYEIDQYVAKLRAGAWVGQGADSWFALQMKYTQNSEEVHAAGRQLRLAMEVAYQNYVGYNKTMMDAFA